MMRVHPDVEALVKKRAEESGENQSRYLEKLIIGWMRADPRNPAIDTRGVAVAGAVSPQENKSRSPLRFAERWQRFVTAYSIVHGSPPPTAWFDDFARESPFTDGEFDDEQPEETSQAALAWAKRVLEKSKKGPK